MRGISFRTPEHLCNCILPVYYQLSDTFRERVGDSLFLIETLRDADRQYYYVSIGASKTMRSKHLPQPPHNKSLAFDVCPQTYLSMKMWHPKGSYWQTLGAIGTQLGLEWGGNWETFPDQPHFQFSHCKCPEKE